MKKVEFIVRISEPYSKEEKDRSLVDMSSFSSTKFFTGVKVNIEDDNIFPAEDITFGFDIVKHIDSPCYVRTITQSIGSHHEIWREPDIDELNLFIKVTGILDDKMNGNLKGGIIYQYCVQRIREEKINTII